MPAYAKKKTNTNLKETDVEEDEGKASYCSRIITKPFIAIFVLLLLFCKFVIKMLSARMPSKLPFFGGKALRELSVFAHVLDIRLRTLCHLPFLFYHASDKFTKTLHIEQRNERHFKAFSELVAVIIDIFVGGFVGLVLFHFSKRSDFVLELLHYGGHVLHMDVLTRIYQMAYGRASWFETEHSPNRMDRHSCTCGIGPVESCHYAISSARANNSFTCRCMWYHG